MLLLSQKSLEVSVLLELAVEEFQLFVKVFILIEDE
jgi:hypothetical protein